MIIGIGTDIMHADQIPDRHLDPADPFFQRTFTVSEAREARKRPSPNAFFRSRFVAKEAVFKSLGLYPDALGRWNKIEVLSNENGAPSVVLHDNIAELAANRGITSIHLSLSNDQDCFLAFCIATDGM